MNITINQEYSELVPEITPGEYKALKQSVKENGLYIPIIVNQSGVILDGHHRYKACHELGIIATHMVREFSDELNEKLFVIDCNLTRRQLNNFQRTELALKSKPILEVIAKRNESLGGKGDRNLTPLGRVDEKIGEKAGVSRDTIRKVQKILESFSEDQAEEVIDKLRAGKISVNEAYQWIAVQGRIPSERKDSTESSLRNSGAIKQVKSDIEEEPLTQEEPQTMTNTERAISTVKPEHREYVRNEEIRYNSFRDLITTLSGLSKDEQRKYDHNARELATSTKKYRFKIIKQMSDTDVRMSYGYSQELSHLLNDFMQQLDDELDIRKAKSKLVSE